MDLIQQNIELYLAAVNVLTFFIYYYDKRAAKAPSGLMWRIPEKILHMLSIVGGTLGALLARWIFRHKTRKFSFRAVFWTIAFLQTTAVSIMYAS